MPTLLPVTGAPTGRAFGEPQLARGVKPNQRRRGSGGQDAPLTRGANNRLTAADGLCYRLDVLIVVGQLLMTRTDSARTVVRVATVCTFAWQWYWATSEGATALA